MSAAAQNDATTRFIKPYYSIQFTIGDTDLSMRLNNLLIINSIKTVYPILFLSVSVNIKEYIENKLYNNKNAHLKIILTTEDQIVTEVTEVDLVIIHIESPFDIKGHSNSETNDTETTEDNVSYVLLCKYPYMLMSSTVNKLVNDKTQSSQLQNKSDGTQNVADEDIQPDMKELGEDSDEIEIFPKIEPSRTYTRNLDTGETIITEPDGTKVKITPNYREVDPDRPLTQGTDTYRNLDTGVTVRIDSDGNRVEITPPSGSNQIITPMDPSTYNASNLTNENYSISNLDGVDFYSSEPNTSIEPSMDYDLQEPYDPPAYNNHNGTDDWVVLSESSRRIEDDVNNNMFINDLTNSFSQLSNLMNPNNIIDMFGSTIDTALNNIFNPKKLDNIGGMNKEVKNINNKGEYKWQDQEESYREIEYNAKEKTPLSILYNLFDEVSTKYSNTKLKDVKKIFDSENYNEDVLGQITIPPMSFVSAIRYLDDLYGLYNGPTHIFFNMHNKFCIWDLSKAIDRSPEYTVHFLVMRENMDDVMEQSHDNDNVFYTYSGLKVHNRSAQKSMLAGTDHILIKKPMDKFTEVFKTKIEEIAERGVGDSNLKILFNEELRKINVHAKNITGQSEGSNSFFNSKLTRYFDSCSTFSFNLTGNIKLSKISRVGTCIKLKPYVDSMLGYRGKYITSSNVLLFSRNNSGTFDLNIKVHCFRENAEVDAEEDEAKIVGQEDMVEVRDLDPPVFYDDETLNEVEENQPDTIKNEDEIIPDSKKDEGLITTTEEDQYYNEVWGDGGPQEWENTVESKLENDFEPIPENAHRVVMEDNNVGPPTPEHETLTQRAKEQKQEYNQEIQRFLDAGGDRLPPDEFVARTDAIANKYPLMNNYGP